MNPAFKFILSVCFLCISVGAAEAQIPTEPAIAKSPNASSLGEYGNVPVSLYTGLPSIGLPLYKLQEGNLSLPIALNYHASGVRPDTHPGWVGMGWSLDAGGVISRNVNDQPDERNQPKVFCNQCGIYFTPGYLNNSTWDQTTFIRNVAVSKWTNSTTALDNNSHYDSEPDEFNFNVAGYSGRFFLDTDGSFKAQCDKPVKIELNSPNNLLAVPFKAHTNSIAEANGGYYPSFSGFSITVENGTMYVFGGTTNAIEYSIGFFAQDRDSWIASSWYLTKIITPEGNTLNLSYSREENKFTNIMYCSGYNVIDMKVQNNATGYLEPAQPCYSWNSGNINIYRSFSGKLIAPVYLTEISSNNTKVQFEHSQTDELRYPSYAYDYKRQTYSGQYFLPFLSLPVGSPQLIYPYYFDNLQWQKLDKIKVYNSSGEFTIGYTFEYSDNPNNSNRANERLTLLKVTEVGKGNITKPPFVFGYENYQALPGYLAMQTDHWGFFNYSTRYRYFSANPQAIAADVNTEYSDREPSTDPAIYLRGMLTTITYPTKGISKFEYAQNTYSKRLADLRSSLDNSINPANYAAGGVRIRRITNWSPDNPNQKTQKTYYYVSSSSLADTASSLSSGVLGGKSRYYFVNYKVPAYNDPNKVCIQSVFSIQSVLPACVNSYGSHIGYSQVIEKNADNSYKVSHFTNFDNGRFDEVAGPSNILQVTRIPYEVYSSNQEMRGKLYKEYYYNNTGQIVKSHDIDYTKVANGFIRSIRASASSICSTADVRIAEGVAYKSFLYSYFPSQERETTYDVNGVNGMSLRKDYVYHPIIRLLKSISSLDSKGNALTTRYQYPVDFPYTNSGSVAPTTELQTLATMSSRNIIATPVEVVSFRNNQVIGAKVNHFQKFGNNIFPGSTEELEIAQPITQGSNNSYIDAAVNQATGSLTFDSRLVIKLAFTDYDTRGNVLGLRKEGNALTSYMWGYNSTLPIAQAANAAPNEIYHSNFEEEKMVAIATTDVAGTWYSPGGYLKFEATPSDPNHPSTRKVAHTGQLAGAMYTGYQGEQAHAFSSTLTIPARSSSRRYILSGWVYTNGPAASIWLFPNLPNARNVDGTVNYYDGLGNSSRPDLFPSYVSTQVDIKPDQVGRWVYLQKEVEVPADATLLTVRLTNFRNGAGEAAASINGGSVWFDDVRLHPADAQMVTSTYDPLAGPTSISDPNNQPTYYEYDGLQRLQLVRDQNGNIVKHLEYHYQR